MTNPPITATSCAENAPNKNVEPLAEYVTAEITLDTFSVTSLIPVGDLQLFYMGLSCIALIGHES